MEKQLEIIATTPEMLRAVLRPVSAEQMQWQPAPGRYSIAEVLAHLVDVEEKALGLRARRIAREDHPLLVSYDPNEQYAAGVYSGKDGPETLERFIETRQASLAGLRELGPDAWRRTGQHPEVGVITLSQIINLWAFHDLGHLRQLAELVRAAVCWEGIGSLQVYYSVNP